LNFTRLLLVNANASFRLGVKTGSQAWRRRRSDFFTRLFSLKSSSACGRRRRALAPLAFDALRGRGEGIALAPAAWAAFSGLFYLIAQPAEPRLLIVPSLALLGALCLIALFDARYFVIPDGPVLFLILAGAATVLASAPEQAASRLAAAAAAFMAMRLFGRAYEALRGTPGVGEGDAKLFGAAGLWLGFAGLPSCLIYAALSALVAAGLAGWRELLRNPRAPIAFGPHLALGLWLVWSVGPLEMG
jgi:leader peptidase (prepilin peptidase)/N-methyltransferase